ncbi:MAG TPA: HlyD family secretion protein [Terriglobales bacterium]|nr:HlyD family secretion protein [Terriglobales bacterium]
MEPTTNTLPEERTETQQHEQSPPPEGRFRSRRSALRNPRVKLGLLIVGVVIVVAGILLWRYFSSYESTDDAQIDGHINPISARISGHVQKLNVNDNQYVEAGTVLVEIDPTDYQVALNKAQATYDDAVATANAAQVNVPITSVSTTSQLTTAQANVENARAGIAAAKQQYAAAKAQQVQAEANNAKAQSDLERYKQLIQKQEISAQQYDQAVAAARAGAATVTAAQAAAEAAQQQITQYQARLAQAEAEVRSAKTFPQQMSATRSRAQAAAAIADQRKADLEQAKLDLQYTKVVAPVAGVVSNRTVEVGQNVQPGQALMMLIPLNDLWVTANFKETQLADMHVGQKATISVDATGKDYKGHVDSLAGASGARFSLLPPENATGNYVKVVQRIPVKIVFEPGQDAEHRLRPGMSVEPKVWIR